MLGKVQVGSLLNLLTVTDKQNTTILVTEFSTLQSATSIHPEWSRVIICPSRIRIIKNLSCTSVNILSLFLNAINQDIMDWASSWNNHKMSILRSKNNYPSQTYVVKEVHNLPKFEEPTGNLKRDTGYDYAGKPLTSG